MALKFVGVNEFSVPTDSFLTHEDMLFSCLGFSDSAQAREWFGDKTKEEIIDYVCNEAGEKNMRYIITYHNEWLEITRISYPCMGDEIFMEAKKLSEIP